MKIKEVLIAKVKSIVNDQGEQDKVTKIANLFEKNGE